MNDPIGLIRPASTPLPSQAQKLQGAPDANTPSFRSLLNEQIEKVNELQRDAKEAVEDLAAGRRNDLESVMLATQKADTAFRMLLQVRNKVMDAYDEVKQMRV